MARKSAKTVEESVVDEKVSIEAVQTADEIVEEQIEQVVEKEATKKTVEAKAKEKPLSESDEIKVVSLVPNVRYLDNFTNDYYRWNNVGHEEIMKFGEIERMWRNTKSYFRNMWLKPDDSRVIKKFGLEKLYKNYDLLMDAKNYTYDNIGNVCKIIEGMTENEMKYAVCSKIKDFVSTGKLNDIRVIKGLESRLGIDLSSSI